MFTKHLGNLAAAGGLVVAALSVGGAANAADPFALTSETFKDGTLMPNRAGKPKKLMAKRIARKQAKGKAARNLQRTSK